MLRKDGTCWVNLGDTYNGSWGSMSHDIKGKAKRTGTNKRPPSSYPGAVQSKSLIGIPMRFALAMMSPKLECRKCGHISRSYSWGTKIKQHVWKSCPECAATYYRMTDPGWILRNVIIWHKPNCMPSSAKDRFTVDFEYLFFFVKSKKYWFEMQYEEHQSPIETKRTFGKKYGDFKNERQNRSTGANSLNSQGRNRRTVWNIPTQPFPEAHFATFPEDLCKIPILSGCPEFVCKKCGKPREKIVENKTTFHSGSGKSGNIPKGKWEGKEQQVSGSYDVRMGAKVSHKTTGYTSCSCNAGFEGGIVLDIFAGKGTSLKVAYDYDRQGIGIDLSGEYIKMGEKYINASKNQGKLFT